MRRESTLWSASLLMAFALTGAGHAADEDSSARLKEMLRRTQEALRQAQSDNADLRRAKSDVEQKLQAATAQLDTLDRGSKAQQSALHAKLSGVEGSNDALTHKLEAAGEQLAATNAKLADTSKQLSLRDAEVNDARQSLEQSKAQYAACETKNITLYSYAEEVLKRYKNKGVWSALSQKDPVFGLKEVEVENVVQEYQLKYDSQKVKP